MHHKRDKKELTRTLVANRARTEGFRGKGLRFETAPYIVDPEKPKYVIRALYGPIKGLLCSRVLVYTNDEDLRQMRPEHDHVPLDDENDGLGKWGPRRFLFELFGMVAKYHGDCVIYMVHNGQEMQVNAEEFEKWVYEANENPVRALLDTALLLEKNP